MNWQKAVDKINVQKFSIPAGWDTKDKIAAELQCSPERVHDLLKGGLASGAFETQEFPVWDMKRRMTVRVRCYRQKSDESKEAPKQGEAVRFQGMSLEDRILAAIERHKGQNNSYIAKRVNGATATMVAKLRNK